MQQAMEGGRFGVCQSAGAISATADADRSRCAINCPGHDYFFAPENEKRPEKGRR
ncbi:hypothetical protein [Burkholderia sp. LMG 32019]|uniref:hypothetical protein n=1 Tax=Burkholderia sp. LMG 32019 TaxID=3158173 RepID=UPI003C2B6665